MERYSFVGQLTLLSASSAKNVQMLLHSLGAAQLGDEEQGQPISVWLSYLPGLLWGKWYCPYHAPLWAFRRKKCSKNVKYFGKHEWCLLDVCDSQAWSKCMQLFQLPVATLCLMVLWNMPTISHCFLAPHLGLEEKHKQMSWLHTVFILFEASERNHFPVLCSGWWCLSVETNLSSVNK